MTQLRTADWPRRAARARELESTHPAASRILRFYAEVLDFQGRVARDIKQTANPSLPLLDQIDPSQVLACFPELLATVRNHGPAPLAKAAHELAKAGEPAWRNLLQAANRDSIFDWFFARAALQPFAEHLQSQLPESADQNARLCPACGALPGLIILRPEGEGVRRSLQCSFCLREWGFRRVICPYCGELDKEKLPTYTAEECKHVRVEACDTCHHYLKSVDLSLDGLAIPVVDEAALAALDIWAGEHGYQKIVKNLNGF
jgi:FdhE protein